MTRSKTRHFLGTLIIALTLSALQTNSSPAHDNSNDLPDGEDWLNYFKDSLMPFYFNAQALGEPIGNFPTWRCNDGQVYIPQDPCNELSKSYQPRESIISKSRQTYFYGVAYHLTGDEKALEYAKAGVDYIRSQAIDPDTGSIATYILNNKPLPATQYRTALQLAYGTLGMAFYYYLTRDQEVLESILKLKDYLFSNYLNPETNLVMWLPVGTVVDKTDPAVNHLKQWQRLAAQLDQINTYLLLLAPIVPEPYRSQWKSELVDLADIMVNQFYDADKSRFEFALDELSEKEQSNHKLKPNFGRTIKAMWMIHFIAKLTENQALSEWVRTNANKVFEQAYIEHNGSWGYRMLEDGTVDESKLSWIYIELEMMAATLAIDDESLNDFLSHTNQYWFDHFVDNANHEIWTWLTPEGDVNDKFPKMLFYKKGFHSAEHALVSYITAQARLKKSATLYFAPSKGTEAENLSPYYFSAKIENTEILELEQLPCLEKLKVNFANIQ